MTPDEPVSSLLNLGRPLLSFEFFPPKTQALADDLLRNAEAIAGHVRPDFVSLTCSSAAENSPAPSLTYLYSQLLRERFHWTIVPHLTCFGRPPEELLAIAESYHRLGIRSLMALRGDLPTGGKFPLDFRPFNPNGVAQDSPGLRCSLPGANSGSLVEDPECEGRQARSRRASTPPDNNLINIEGFPKNSEPIISNSPDSPDSSFLPNRNFGDALPPSPLSHASDLVSLLHTHLPSLCLGVAGYPEKHPEATSPASDLQFLKQKVSLGASFITTQLFFEAPAYFRFVADSRAAGITAPILPGLLPVLSLDQATRFCARCGTTLPPALLARLQTVPPADQWKVGVEWTLELIQELLTHGAPGIHLYLLNRSQSLLRLVQELNFRGLFTACH